MHFIKTLDKVYDLELIIVKLKINIIDFFSF